MNGTIPIPIIGTQITEIRYCGLGPSDASLRAVPNSFGQNPLNDFVNNEGTVTQAIVTSGGGFFQVTAPVLAPNAAANSFYVRLDSGPWQLWDQVPTGAGKVATQALIFAPGIGERLPGDFFCWKMGTSHTLSLRWRELGAFVGPLVVTSDLPALQLLDVAGCPVAGKGCRTRGGPVLSLSLSGLCPQDVRVLVGGVACANLTTSSTYPNRIVTCLLPEARGGIVNVTVQSAGRTAVLPAAVKYAAPEVANVTQCRGGASCAPGETITIYGTDFGVSGAEVTVFGNPCESVLHDPMAPHETVVCVISNAPPASSSGLAIGQAGQTTAFTGLYASKKPLDSGAVGGGVSAGALALGLLAALAVWARRRAQRAREARRILFPAPWRLQDVSRISAAPNDDGMYSCVISGESGWLFELKGASLVEVDRFCEALHKASLPALAEILGVHYRSPADSAMLAFRGGGRDAAPVHTTLQAVLEAPGHDLALVVGNLAHLARAADLLHSFSVELPSRLNLEGSVMLRDGSGDEADSERRIRATFSPYILAGAIERGLAGRASSESAGVIRFAKFCCVALGSSSAVLGGGEEGNGFNKSGRDQLKGAASPGGRYLATSTRSNVNLVSVRSITSLGTASEAAADSSAGPLGLNEAVPAPLGNLLAACIRPKNKNRPTFGVLAELLAALERELVVTKLVEIRTEELRKANKRSDELLSRMIPALYLPLVREGQHIPAKRFPEVTVFFCDIVSFTTTSSDLPPEAVVSALDQYIATLDALCLQHSLTRINTIGDAYFAVCGAPAPVPDHCLATVAFARGAIKATGAITIGANKAISIRVGIHSGVVAGGIQGGRIPRFDVFGDTVNTASRMESSGTPGRINMTEETFAMFKAQGGKPMGAVDARSMEIKGKGVMKTVTID